MDEKEEYTWPMDVLNRTRGEGFGLPLLEAEACGIPIITTRAREGEDDEEEIAPGLIYEDQHINCQDAPCGNAPLGCADKRHCPKT